MTKVPNKNEYSISRMCPPGLFKFCFSVKGNKIYHDCNIPLIPTKIALKENAFPDMTNI